MNYDKLNKNYDKLNKKTLANYDKLNNVCDLLF